MSLVSEGDSKGAQAATMIDNNDSPLLGDFRWPSHRFDCFDQVVSPFHSESFARLNPQEQNERVNQTLLTCILDDQTHEFLLDAVVDFISYIRNHHVIPGYTFTDFELWLNHFSQLSEEENYAVRGKIMGRMIPREQYQPYFPIGMGKIYPGTHLVTAHPSPDLDTTIASFWGWVDAFAARVGRGRHLWNLPGGPPYAQVEVDFLFRNLFGEEVFDCLAKTQRTLSLNSLDLMTQEGMGRKYPHEMALDVHHARARSAIVLIDDKGCYLGDWRAVDVEGVRQVIMGLNNCLLWLEAFAHIKLISCLAKPEVFVGNVTQAIEEILSMPLNQCHPAKDFTPALSKFVDHYLLKVLEVEGGLGGTVQEFGLAMERAHVTNFTQMTRWLSSLARSNLFDQRGGLTTNRSLIFNQLEILFKMISETLFSIRNHVDRLDIALKIKREVFDLEPQSVAHNSDIDEIRAKMDSYSHLTVNLSRGGENIIPIGVIYASDLQKETLGTVSLRDFCSREEMAIPPYLQIISIIDHHKGCLETESPATAVISDAQSSCALVANLSLAINDQYSLGGMTPSEIEEQLEVCAKALPSPTNLRIQQRLLKKKGIAQRCGPHTVSPKREFIESWHLLHGILDDTDLLTKVSPTDVFCTASLLNRLTSLRTGREVEIVHFDDIEEDHHFTKRAAQRLLQNPDFYSLYRKVYLLKEKMVGESFKKCAEGKQSHILEDTKILSGCNRVGQTKMFASNYPLFEQVAPTIRSIWHRQASNLYHHQPSLILHLHMISTLISAEELFQGREPSHSHLDELWVWIPQTPRATSLLKRFLYLITSAEVMKGWNPSVEFFGDCGQSLSQIFNECFYPVSHRFAPKDHQKPDPPIVVIRYSAGQLNSRKSMLAPFLPTIDA